MITTVITKSFINIYGPRCHVTYHVAAMRLLKSSVEVSRAGGGLLTCSLQAVTNLNWLSALKK